MGFLRKQAFNDLDEPRIKVVRSLTAKQTKRTNNAAREDQQSSTGGVPDHPVQPTTLKQSEHFIKALGLPRSGEIKGCLEPQIKHLKNKGPRFLLKEHLPD